MDTPKMCIAKKETRGHALIMALYRMKVASKLCSYNNDILKLYFAYESRFMNNPPSSILGTDIRYILLFRPLMPNNVCGKWLVKKKLSLTSERDFVFLT